MVKGLRSLSRKLTKTIPENIRRAAVKALEQWARELVAEMKRLVPVDEGVLRDSIGWTWGDAPAGAFTIGQVFGRNFVTLRITVFAAGGAAFHGFFHEFGTKNMPANPFFFTSHRKLRRRGKGRITRAITKEMKKV